MCPASAGTSVPCNGDGACKSDTAGNFGSAASIGHGRCCRLVVSWSRSSRRTACFGWAARISTQRCISLSLHWDFGVCSREHALYASSPSRRSNRPCKGFQPRWPPLGGRSLGASEAEEPNAAADIMRFDENFFSSAHDPDVQLVSSLTFPPPLSRAQRDSSSRPPLEPRTAT